MSENMQPEKVKRKGKNNWKIVSRLTSYFLLKNFTYISYRESCNDLLLKDAQFFVSCLQLTRSMSH